MKYEPYYNALENVKKMKASTVSMGCVNADSDSSSNSARSLELIIILKYRCERYYF